MSKLNYFFIIAGMVICGCVSTDIQPPLTSGFFDLKTFFEKEIAEKAKTVSTFQKTVTLDGVSEMQKLTTFNLADELKVFSEANINKTAWLDRYEADSIFSDKGSLEKITYTALKEDLRTQKLSVHFDNKKVDTIYIRQISENLLAGAAQILLYVPEYGYKIENRQKITSLDPHKLSVDVVFVR